MKMNDFHFFLFLPGMTETAHPVFVFVLFFLDFCLKLNTFNTSHEKQTSQLVLIVN